MNANEKLIDEIERLKNELCERVKQLREERDALKNALASGLCSAHRDPDPLNCDVCNSAKVHFNAASEWMAERDRLLHALKTVLPMAKGYAAANPVGRNNQIVLWAERIADNPEQKV